MNAFIEKKVHELYWDCDVNCARTMLICLGELFGVTYEPQTLNAAVGLHGAGGYRAQCGLVEGSLMFAGVYLNGLGWEEERIVSACYRFAETFSGEFGSLTCFDLRPGGFSPDDPPHRCEALTCRAVEFTYKFMKAL